MDSEELKRSSGSEDENLGLKKYKVIDYQASYPWLKEACPLSPDSALQNIASFLTKLLKPNPTVLTTHFYDDEELSQILQRAVKIIRPKLEELGEPFVEDFDNWMAKAGPRSPRKGWDEVAEIYEGYFHTSQVNASYEDIERAFDEIMHYTGLDGYVGRLEPMDILNATEAMPKTTNWGCPFYLHGRVFEYEQVIVDGTKTLTGQVEMVEDHVDMYVDLANAMAKDPTHPGWSSPNLPFRRTDMKGPAVENTSQRAVWGQPHAVTILEKTIEHPIQKLVQTIGAPGFRANINEEAITKAIKNQLREAHTEEAIVLGVDKDKWDHHVGQKWIDPAFARIRTLFREGSVPDYFDSLVRFFKTSGMITPGGLLTGRAENVSSGSAFTLWLNTFIHLAVLKYTYNQMYPNKELDFSAECKGDDGTLIVYLKDVHKFVEITNELTGMVNSEEKQFAVPGFTSFAKKTYSLDVDEGIPPAPRTLTSAKHPDIGVSPDLWTGYYESGRYIMELNNYWNTPIFEDMARIYIEGDSKYGLGTLLPGGVDEVLRRAGGPLLMDRFLGIESYVGAYKGARSSSRRRLPLFVWLDNYSAA